MEKIVEQINHFSRKRLLIKFMPILLGLFIASFFLPVTQAMFNFIALIILFCLAHPYLVNFEDETCRYYQYLKKQESQIQNLIDRKKNKYNSCINSKSLDLTSSRRRFMMIKNALERSRNDISDRSYFDLDSPEYLAFKAKLQRRMYYIKQQSKNKKHMLLHSIERDIKHLQSKKNNIIKLETLIQNTKASPHG